MDLRHLIQERSDLIAEARSILDGDSRTDAQTARLDEIEGRVASVNADMAREERIRALERELPASHEMETAPAPAITGTPPAPFRSLGEQLVAVAQAARNPHSIDQRLMQIQAVASGASEGTLSDGGYAVQTDFSTELLREVHAASVLYGRTRTIPIGANSNGLKINAVDETSRADGSRWGGVVAYWTGEAGALTASKPKYRQVEMSLQKLTGLYYATDELLMDAAALGAAAGDAFTEEFGFKLDDALLRGSGAGMPLGVIGHAGTVSISKETNQPALTILKENVEKMYARMPASSVSKATWYINQDCWPALFGLSAVVGLGGVPLFIPSNSLANAPFGTLLGRPVEPIEQAATLGTVGDIIFADWSEYLTIEKGGIQQASSIHVQFLTDETVFRWILRADGQPKRNTTMTPAHGSANQSPFVTLNTRA